MDQKALDRITRIQVLYSSHKVITFHFPSSHIRESNPILFIFILDSHDTLLAVTCLSASGQRPEAAACVQTKKKKNLSIVIVVFPKLMTNCQKTKMQQQNFLGLSTGWSTQPTQSSHGC